MEAASVEKSLKIGGISLRGIDAVSSGNAVAKQSTTGSTWDAGTGRCCAAYREKEKMKAVVRVARRRSTALV